MNSMCSETQSVDDNIADVSSPEVYITFVYAEPHHMKYFLWLCSIVALLLFSDLYLSQASPFHNNNNNNSNNNNNNNHQTTITTSTTTTARATNTTVTSTTTTAAAAVAFNFWPIFPILIQVIWGSQR